MSLNKEAPSSIESIKANRYEIGSKAVNVDGKPTISYEEVDGKQLPVLDVPVTIYNIDPTGKIKDMGQYTTYRITLDPENDFAVKWSFRVDDESGHEIVSSIRDEVEKLLDTQLFSKAIEQVREEA